MNSAKGPLAGRYLSRGTTTQVDRLFIFPNPFAFFVFRLERQNSLELYDLYVVLKIIGRSLRLARETCE